MKIWLPAIFYFFFCCSILAQELHLAPGGGSDHSEVILTRGGDIQAETASGIKTEHCGDRLKVTITSRRKAGWKIRYSGSKDDDTRMFSGETAEVFLQPDSTGDYYHLAVNPAGNLYSARNKDMAWTPSGVRVKTAIHPDRWTAEFEIPYAALNSAPPRAGAVWRANFALSTYLNGSRKPSSWSGAVNFHDPQEFGKLVFTGRRKAKLEMLYAADGKLHGKIFIPADLRSRSTVSCIIGDKRHIISATEFSLPLGDKEITPKDLIDVIIQCEAQKEKLFSLHARAFYLSAGKFELDRFYLSPSDRAVKYQHDLMPPVQLKLYRDNQLLRIVDDLPPTGIIPLDGIRPGRLIAEIRSLKTGVWCRKLLFMHDKSLQPPPLAPGGISLDGQRVRIGGKPAFLISCNSNSKKGLHSGKVFNMYMRPYGKMDNAIMIRRLPRIKLIRKPTVGNIYHNNWLEVMDKVIAAASKNQIIRITYEAHLDVYFRENGELKRCDPVRFYQQVYRIFKKKYPGTIFSIHSDRSTEIVNHARSCDILEGAYWSSSYSANILNNIIHDLDDLKQNAGNKPAIFWLGASVPDYRIRCAEELRAGVYCAVFKDMAGVIFHAGHGGIPADRTRLWSLLSGINAEISQWYTGYAEGEKLDDFILSSPDGFLVKAWRFRGKNYIGVVNLTTRNKDLILKFKGGSLKERFTPCDAKIYPL